MGRRNHACANRHVKEKRLSLVLVAGQGEAGWCSGRAGRKGTQLPGCRQSSRAGGQGQENTEQGKVRQELATKAQAEEAASQELEGEWATHQSASRCGESSAHRRCPSCMGKRCASEPTGKSMHSQERKGAPLTLRWASVPVLQLVGSAHVIASSPSSGRHELTVIDRACCCFALGCAARFLQSL